MILKTSKNSFVLLPGIFSIDPRKRAEEETWVYSNLHYFPHWLKDLDKLPVRLMKDPKTQKNIQNVHTVIDFDDMVRLPCLYKMAEHYKLGRDAALVDESQDMNAYQIHLVTQLCKIGVRIVCCGDRLQAIYAFRGSFMDSMDRMKNTTGAGELPLSVTYRCRQAIVDYVNDVIPGSTMIAYKEGGSVATTFKKDFVHTVLTDDVSMIVGARNKSLVECWITLAKAKVSSTLKGSGIVKESRGIIHDIKPESIEMLCQKLQEAINDAIVIDADGEATYKIPESQVELMTAIPELIETYDIHTLDGLKDILAEMEQDAVREIHTVHSSKGLEAPVVMVLGWRPDVGQYIGSSCFRLPLNTLILDGILILYPSSPGSSVNLPSGASFRNGYTTAMFCKEPGMRPMPGLRVSHPHLWMAWVNNAAAMISP
jgi:hypothetical protein